MIYLVATLTVKPDQRAEFITNARDVIAATRREAGCISYELTNSVTEPDTFLFVERWQSRDALDAHFQTPHFLHWRDLCANYLSSRKLEIIKPDSVESPA